VVVERREILHGLLLDSDINRYVSVCLLLSLVLSIKPTKSELLTDYDRRRTGVAILWFLIHIK